MLELTESINRREKKSLDWNHHKPWFNFLSIGFFCNNLTTLSFIDLVVRKILCFCCQTVTTLSVLCLFSAMGWISSSSCWPGSTPALPACSLRPSTRWLTPATRRCSPWESASLCATRTPCTRKLLSMFTQWSKEHRSSLFCFSKLAFLQKLDLIKATNQNISSTFLSDLMPKVDFNRS